jgi:uncharacterized protein YndB with AHSA1/START domain
MFEKAFNATSLELKYVFDAPRERVWRAWTDPAALKQWFRTAPDFTTPVAEVDLRVGGRFRLGMQGPGVDEMYIATGEYLEIQPPEKLVFTWTWEGTEDPETLVTVELRSAGSKTEVKLRHEGFEAVESRDLHASGWQGCLTQLAAYATVKEV